MDSVLFWNDVALEAVAQDHSGPNPAGEQGGPAMTSRALGIVHAAIYDAAVSFDGTPTPHYRFRVPVAGANVEYAICGAALTTLRALYPAQRERFDSKFAAFKTQFTSGTAKSHFLGFEAGSEVGHLLLQERQNDGSDENRTPKPSPLSYPHSHDEVAYKAGDLPGMHNQDPLHPAQGFYVPKWGKVVPFVVADVLASRAPAPPPLRSPEYLASFDQVAKLGRFRTFPFVTPKIPVPDRPDQEMLDLSGDVNAEIGIFWAYDGANKIGPPPRFFNQIGHIVSAKLNLNVQENALFFAALNLALADAGISGWDTKYFYNLWRPILGIRHHPGPQRQPDWKPLGSPRSNTTGGDDFTPPFPSYTSGHATFGGAVFTVMKAFFELKGKPLDTPFDVTSDELNGKTTDSKGNLRPLLPQTLTLDQAILQNLWSRVYLGVHWDFDGIEGVKSGEKIGREVANFFGLPNSFADLSDAFLRSAPTPPLRP